MLTSNDITFTEKRRKTESQKKLMPGSANTSTEIREGDHTEDLEFPLIRFADIVAATGNFSKTCMIGRGGFGKVYKVGVLVLFRLSHLNFSVHPILAKRKSQQLGHPKQFMLKINLLLLPFERGH
jgi:hypothetical protein